MSTAKTKSTDKKNDVSVPPSEEDIDEIIKRITLKQPRTPFSLYISDMYAKENKEEQRLSLIEVIKKYSKIWMRLTSTVKAKYTEAYLKEKEQYKRDLLIVKNTLFRNCTYKSQTPYQLFLEEKLRLALENEKDLTEAEKAAEEEWSIMSKEDKKRWKDKKKENDSWLAEAKKRTVVNGFSVFTTEKMQKCREKGESLTLKEVSEIWRKMADKDKMRYGFLAQQINKERKQKRLLYEVVHGIKPKRPCGAYKIFLSEKAKEGLFEGKNAFVEGMKLWNKLPTEKKDEYLKKSHKLHLIYMYSNILYKKSVRESLPQKNPSAFNFFVSDMKGKLIPSGMNSMVYYRTKWNSLDQNAREKYETKEKKAKEDYQKEKEKCANRVYDIPKKPLSSYNIFFRKEVVKGLNNKTSVMRDISNKWEELSQQEKEKYRKKAEKDKERYERELKEFKELKYYTIEEKKIKPSSSIKKRSFRSEPAILSPLPSSRVRKSNSSSKKRRR